MNTDANAGFWPSGGSLSTLAEAFSYTLQKLNALH
uniref:Uncharacterized protein n=1 Tax=Arundo donax TaxID=35708 RepID=A0A0A9FIE5_ARUDO